MSDGLQKVSDGFGKVSYNIWKVSVGVGNISNGLGKESDAQYSVVHTVVGTARSCDVTTFEAKDRWC